jgi:hypothetical protein
MIHQCGQEFAKCRGQQLPLHPIIGKNRKRKKCLMMFFPLSDSGKDSERLCITHAHTSQLGVCHWGCLRLSDRQKELRNKVENIS